MFTYVIYKDINTYREKGRVCRRARRWKKEKKEYLYCKNLHIIFRGLCQMKKIHFVCCSKYREELAAASTISGPLSPCFLSASSSSAEQCSFPNGSLDHGAFIGASLAPFQIDQSSFRGITISHRLKRVNSVTG